MALRAAPEREAWRHRDAVWSWADVRRAVDGVVTGLVAQGVGRGDRVALVGRNTPAWVVGELAVLTLGAIAVPLAYTGTRSEWAAILRRSDARLLLADPELDTSGLPCPVHGLGAWHELAPVAIDVTSSPQDVAMILFTSGTTGRPKGVLLTHGNLLAAAHALLERYPDFAAPDGYRIVSYLPLAHVSEQLFHITLATGLAGHVHFCDRVEDVTDALRQARPTFFLGVPAVWQKLSEASAGCDDPRTTLGLDRAHTVTSGAAPLSRELLDAFSTAGLPILEGYGLTEAAGLLTVPHPNAREVGSVGVPVSGTELRLGKAGDVQVRGPQVCKGYWDDEALTSASWTKDGWFRTGDLGAWSATGQLRITGRLKDLIVTSMGKNVAPAPLEARLLAVSGVTHAMVVGEGRPHLVAAVSGRPSPEGLQEALAAMARDLAPELRVRRVAVVAPPGPEALTPTGKVSRTRWVEALTDEIDALYADS